MIQIKKPLEIDRIGKAGLVWWLTFVVLLAPYYFYQCRSIDNVIQLNEPAISVMQSSGVRPSSFTVKDMFYQPPVLCYHQVRDWTDSDSKGDRTYIVPVKIFREHMKILRDSGYHALLPEQWATYMERGARPPEKSIILTFDDGTLGQYENALPELDRYDYKAVFFIMTVAIGKTRYMTRRQLRHLTEDGHVIGCHTWDHHDVRFYKEEDWKVQLTEPTRVLEEVTGRPVRYFAYPFGSWNEPAVKQLMIHRYEMAFQLSGPLDHKTPEFTVRRILVDGRWNGTKLMKAMSSF